MIFSDHMKRLTFVKNDLIATLRLRAHFRRLIQKQELDYHKGRKFDGQNLRTRKINWEIKEN